MALKKWFWLKSIAFCLHKQGDLFVYLFSSMHNEWNTLLLLPRSKVSWIKSQCFSHSDTYSFSLSRGQEVGQSTGKPGDMANSVLLQLSTCQNVRSQLSEVGRFAEFGDHFPGRLWEELTVFLEAERLFCGHTQPLLYQWKAFTSQLLEAHHEKEPRFGYEPVIASPLTTTYKHWDKKLQVNFMFLLLLVYC